MKDRPARHGQNARTGESIAIAASKVPSFRLRRGSAAWSNNRDTVRARGSAVPVRYSVPPACHTCHICSVSSSEAQFSRVDLPYNSASRILVGWNSMERDLRDLIENPREDLEVEVKSWLDLKDKVQRAKLARHLAALANNGGGYILFGFRNDLTKDENRPSSLEDYNRDTITAIVKKYLTPVFQCVVRFELDRYGNKVPIVVVPSHDMVPIVAKADGPKDSRGRIQGIESGRCYIRKAGPESAPIVNADEWGPLIRRCVLNDRDRLLTDFSALVHPPTRPDLDAADRLVKWHQRGGERFQELARNTQGFAWPVPIQKNHYQLSYMIATEDNDVIPVDTIVGALERVNHEVRNTVWTGWSMFFPFRGDGNSPSIQPEEPDGTGSDVLETSLIAGGDFEYSLPDFWRISPYGLATLIRAYREDRERTVKACRRAAGTWFSPTDMIRETAELVTHARLMARQFDTATRVNFRCSWYGLHNRQIAEFDPSVYWSPGHSANADSRTIEGTCSIPELAAKWPTVVSELAGPVLRLFGIHHCSPEYVSSLQPKFRSLDSESG